MQITNKIFDMVAAITAGKTKRAMDLYEDLLTLREPPMRILFLIARQFNQLLLVRELQASGADRGTVASKLKVPPFVAGKLSSQAAAFTKEQLISYVQTCVDAEEAVKTGRMGDRLAVELLMAVASILAINVTEQLDENAKDLLTMRVRNRASYVQEILRNAEDLEQLSEQITATTQQLLKSGDISLDTMDNGSEQSDALLVALAPQLLDTLRTKQVTGIFLILNTHDLDTCEVGKKMPGIYLRDMDPDAALRSAQRLCWNAPAPQW